MSLETVDNLPAAAASRAQMRVTKRYGVLVGTLGLLTATTAWAQGSKNESVSSTELEKVVISAKKLEEQLPSILEVQGVRVDTITADQIAKGGYLDIAQSLQMLAPGLYVSPRNGPFDYVDISLLGSRTQDVLWLLDGVRMNNRLYAGTTPLDTLPSTIVDRLQVLEGGQALFYGTEAAAGAVDIVTKQFTDTPDGAVSVGGDTNESGHFDGYYRDSIDRNHFVVYADVDASQGFRPFRNQDIQPSDTDRDRAYRVYTAGAKYAYDFSDDLRYSALIQHTTAKLNFSLPFFVESAFNDRDETVLTSKLDYTPSDAFQFFVKGYYHWWYSHYTEFDNVVGSTGTVSVDENDGFWGYVDRGVNLMAKFKLNTAFDEILGYDFQNYEGHDAVLVIQHQTESVNAVFGQIATSGDLMAHTTLAAGVRYNDPTVGQSATIWTVSGKHDIADDLFVRGQVGTAFRLPTAEELFANDPFDERGDPNLKPEKSTNVNVSIGGKLDTGHFKWELIGFWRNVTNFIDYASFDDTTQQAVFGNVPGTVKVRGGELEVGAEFADYSADLSYTYSHSVQDGNLQIDAVPVQQAKASFDYHPEAQPFGVTVSAIFVGAEWRSGLGADDGRAEYGKYPLVDLAGRYFIDSKRHHIISLRLENVFDRQYASSLGTGVRDSDGSDYVYWNLGVPRTLEGRYTFKF
jgi:outer membrane cobalamin receptor